MSPLSTSSLQVQNCFVTYGQCGVVWHSLVGYGVQALRLSASEDPMVLSSVTTANCPSVGKTLISMVSNGMVWWDMVASPYG